MESVAVCGPALEFSPYCHSVGRVLLDGVEVTVGRTLDRRPPPDATPTRAGHDVLVRVTAFSLNYRDRALIAYLAATMDERSYCYVGSEFVAEVVEIGGEVSSVGPGDRVIGNCQYPVPAAPGVPPGIPTQHSSQRFHVLHERQVTRVPKTMTDPVAAAFSIGAQTAFSMLRVLSPEPGSRVLVTAATSNTAIFMINALAGHGVRLTALTTSRGHDDALRALGVEDVLHPGGEVSGHDHVAVPLPVAGGYDYVVDPFADLYLQTAVQMMAHGATYVGCGVWDQSVAGTDGPGVTVEIARVMGEVILRGLHVVGNCLGTEADLRSALVEYEAGHLPVVVDSVFSGGDVSAFFDRTYNDPTRFGKVVFVYE